MTPIDHYADDCAGKLLLLLDRYDVLDPKLV